MKKLFIISLVVAELAMVGGALPKKFRPTALIAPPPPVDRNWARAMSRQVDQARREDVLKSSHRAAVESCVGPNGASMSPGRYEAKAKLCEARLAGAPVEDPEARYYPPPAPVAPEQASAEAAAPPAAGDAS